MRSDVLQFNYPTATLPFATAVSPEIAAFDEMFADDNRQAYFECGASALNCVLASVQLAAVPVPARVLDFGCGAGRVTRWLRAAYPDAEIHACEIDRLGQGLRFVQDQFRAVTWNSEPEVAKLHAPLTYDLIWVGSVFTHLSADASQRLFAKLKSWLNPDGVIVFSVHGRRALFYDTQNPKVYGLLPDERDSALRQLRETGFGYSDYTWSAEQGGGYGISFSTSEWWVRFVEQQPGMKLVVISEAAWDKHQDIVAVMNRPTGNPVSA